MNKKIVIIGGVYQGSICSHVYIPDAIDSYLYQYGEPEYIPWVSDYKALCAYIESYSEGNLYTQFFYFPTMISKTVARQIDQNKVDFINFLGKHNASLGVVGLVNKLGYLYTESIKIPYTPQGIFFEDNTVAKADWHFFENNVAQKITKANRRRKNKKRFAPNGHI